MPTAPATRWDPLDDGEVARLGDGGIVVRDGVVDAAVVARLRAVLAGWSVDGRMTVAGLGGARVVRPGWRGDLTCWVEPGDLPDAVGLFEAVRANLVASTWVALDGFELQAACYPGGGARYVRHVDALRGDAARRFTAILYLNPTWQRAHGGRLCAWTPQGRRMLPPYGGRVVVFRSDALPHAVTPSIAPRYALTAWMRGP